MPERTKDPLWLRVLLGLFLGGPLVFLAVVLFGWVFLGVVLLEALALIGIDQLQAAWSGHPFGTWLLAVLVLAGASWLYWCLGGPQPGMFAFLSLAMALLGVAGMIREMKTRVT